MTGVAWNPSGNVPDSNNPEPSKSHKYRNNMKNQIDDKRKQQHRATLQAMLTQKHQNNLANMGPK